MGNFDRFQSINGKRKRDAQMKLNSRFIINGYPTIDIVECSGNSAAKNTIKASVVNKEDRDEAYIYTNIDNPLEIGSSWKAKELFLLIDKEYTIIKDVFWHKYHCLICNVNIDNVWGYFQGPEKSYINISLKQDVLLQSQQKPILVLPNKILNFGDKIMIENRAWGIQEFDSISTKGITYYSLFPTTMSKDNIKLNENNKNSYIEKADNNSLYVNEIPMELVDNIKQISSGVPITIKTINGYFKSNNRNINIQKHTNNEVTFTIPYGVSELTIQTKGVKDSGEEIIETIYQIVEQ